MIPMCKTWTFPAPFHKMSQHGHTHLYMCLLNQRIEMHTIARLETGVTYMTYLFSIFKKLSKLEIGYGYLFCK